MKRKASEIVMEAVANSDTVTIEDMNLLDIRDKIVFRHEESGAHCAYCLMGLDHLGNHPSELETIVHIANNSRNEANKPSKVIEKIYYNEIASVEAIAGFINISTEKGLLEALVIMAEKNISFRLKLLMVLSKADLG